MKTTTVIALSLALSLLTLNTSYAEEDPFAGFDDLFSELESLEDEASSESGSSESSSGSSEIDTETAAPENSSSDSLAGDDLFGDLDALLGDDLLSSATEETPTTTAEETPVNSRFYQPEIPEGKENHILYKVPGAIEHHGMTFININSGKFFNKFQRCNLSENEVVTDRLSRLKISQGAALACREDMRYKFQPYKTYRTQR